MLFYKSFDNTVADNCGCISSIAHQKMYSSGWIFCEIAKRKICYRNCAFGPATVAPQQIHLQLPTYFLKRQFSAYNLIKYYIRHSSPIRMTHQCLSKNTCSTAWCCQKLQCVKYYRENDQAKRIWKETDRTRNRFLWGSIKKHVTKHAGVKLSAWKQR